MSPTVALSDVSTKSGVGVPVSVVCPPSHPNTVASPFAVVTLPLWLVWLPLTLTVVPLMNVVELADWSAPVNDQNPIRASPDVTQVAAAELVPLAGLIRPKSVNVTP